MFCMWGEIIKGNRFIKDTTICIGDYSMLRTEMVLKALDEMCYELDLGKPIWSKTSIHDFQRHSKARFGQDCSIEHIEFGYLEIQVIEG